MAQKFANYHPYLMSNIEQFISTNPRSTNIVQYKKHQILLNQANIKANLNNGITPGNRYFANKKTKIFNLNNVNQSPNNNNIKKVINDASLKPQTIQLVENFTKTGDTTTQFSLDSIDMIKLKINEIISFFLTSSDGKNNTEDLLFDIIAHLFVILKSKGSIETINKLNKLLIETSELSNLTN